MSLPVEQITGANGLPGNIGRFEVLRQLGKGSQGVVYLAHDPQLDRHVAIKTLDRRRDDHSHLLHEARNVSKLEHPHITPIYEIGVHQDMPYLVYQYCEGNSLRNLLETKENFKPLDAVKIISQLLDAIGYAHRHGIVHRDLNPSNIMLVEDNVPRIMDFGISIMMGTFSRTSDVVGTVNYMAPEQITNNEIGPSVDIFSIGLILHEMLTGQQVFSADNSMAVIYKITNENILAPSKRNTNIDTQLDEIVMQALQREPSARYGSAAEMKASLDIYARPEETADGNNNIDGDDRKSTVQFLLRRMKRKKDFPAISTHITEINKKTSNRDISSATELSNVILKDYAITTKLLRLVNTSFYGQFGGEITTVSRAVVILGYEQVRAATLSIILFEHLNNPSQAKELKKGACTALMSGIMAREQAKSMSRLKEEDIETAFIASMFHKLGKLLAIYYLPEEYAEIKNLIINRGLKEHQAVLSVLGASYEDLGKGIAEDWQLPDIITNSMRKIPDGPVKRAKNNDEAIIHLANFSNELCAISTKEGNTSHELEELSNRYNKAIGLSVKDIKKLVETSKEEVTEFTKSLNIDIEDLAPFSTKNDAEKDDGLKVTTKKIETAKNDTDNLTTSMVGADHVSDNISDADKTAASGNETTPPKTESEQGSLDNIAQKTDPSGTNETPGSADTVTQETTVTGTIQSPSEPDPFNRQEILVLGIAEITNTMLEDYNLNDLLTMVLETVYRGMGFSRVLFCIRDGKNNLMLGRFGLGKDIGDIIPNFRCDLKDEQNIFSQMVRDGETCYVPDVNADEHKHLVPDWLRKLTMPCVIVAHPIIINKRCIGMFYADMDDTSIQLAPDVLRFFKTLGNQAALAIQQMQSR